MTQEGERPGLDASRARRSSGPVSVVIVGDLLRAADLLAIYATGMAMQQLYLADRFPVDLQSYHLAALIGVFFFFSITVLRRDSLYDLHGSPAKPLKLGRLALSWGLAIIGVVTVGFAFKLSSGFSRVWAGGWFLSALAVMAAMRVALRLLTARWAARGRLAHNIAVIGSGRYAEQVIDALRLRGDDSMRIVGYFDDCSAGETDGVVGCRRLGTVDDLVAYARENRIDHLIVSLPWSAEQRVVEILRKLRPLVIDIYIAPDLVGLHLRGASYTEVCGIPMLEVSRKPFRDWRLVAKTVEDFVLAVLLLLFLAPLFPIVALAIKWETRGPVFFRQKRHGFDNRLINVYKFRTMFHEASDPLAARLVTRDDPRVTRVGAFLRKSSIDELPQLFNVLRGEMSIVGPRPHPLLAKAADLPYEEVMAEYIARHRVKPGITGWAQVRGWRGETDTVDKLVQRVEHDLFYIENWSLSFDLLILLRTPLAMLKTKNAY